MRVLVGIAFAVVLAGCSARAAEMRRITLDDEELSKAEATDAGGWQSAPWSDAKWIAFPGQTAIEIEHALGREPSSVLVYLSFVGDDRNGRERTSFLGAGDTAHIYALTGSSVSGRRFVTIENTTAADFYLRIVLQ